MIIVGGAYYYFTNPKDQPRTSFKSTQTLPQGDNALKVQNNLHGDYVTIPFVRLSKPGYVMIHASENGQPGEIIMTGSLLEKGEHTNVNVRTGIQTNPGEKYFAMLHTDNGNSVYDNLSLDEPIVINGKIVQEEFSIVSSIEASFSVITHKITRSFDNAMYKNQSKDVYIPNENSKAVVVTANGVTWGDFFETLPFSVSSDCLVTGDGDRLCNGEDGTLTFEINGENVDNALSQRINEGDDFIIRYE